MCFGLGIEEKKFFNLLGEHKETDLRLYVRIFNKAIQKKTRRIFRIEKKIK